MCLSKHLLLLYPLFVRIGRQIGIRMLRNVCQSPSMFIHIFILNAYYKLTMNVFIILWLLYKDCPL